MKYNNIEQLVINEDAQVIFADNIEQLVINGNNCKLVHKNIESLVNNGSYYNFETEPISDILEYLNKYLNKADNAEKRMTRQNLHDMLTSFDPRYGLVSHSKDEALVEELRKRGWEVSCKRTNVIEL